MERKPLTTAEQALADAAFDYHRSPTRGKISITPLHLALTHEEARAKLARVFGGVKK